MDIKNNEGKTAYDVAVELGDEACMELLGQGSAADYIFYLEDEGVMENHVFAAIMHEMWEELGEGREIRNVAYEEDVQKIPLADVNKIYCRRIYHDNAALYRIICTFGR